MHKLRWIFALLLGVAACQAKITPTATTAGTLPTPRVTVSTSTPAAAVASTRPAGAATATPAGEAPMPAAALSQTVPASDGVTLAASYYPPVLSVAGAKAPGVLLLPMYGHSRADWDSFARELQKRGLAVLALDLRGQGQSGGPEDWSKAPADVAAAWAALTARPEVDAEHTGVAGASIGANLALIAGANNPKIATVIALSPGQDYKGIKPAGTLGQFGQRGVFFVASQDDTYAYDSVRQLAPLVPKGETYYFAKAGHGTAMLTTPALPPLLFKWLEDHLGLLKG